MNVFVCSINKPWYKNDTIFNLVIFRMLKINHSFASIGPMCLLDNFTYRVLSLINTWCWRTDCEILISDGEARVNSY